MTTVLKENPRLQEWVGNLFDPGDFATHIPSGNITGNEKEFKIEMPVSRLERKDYRVEAENGYQKSDTNNKKIIMKKIVTSLVVCADLFWNEKKYVPANIN